MSVLKPVYKTGLPCDYGRNINVECSFGAGKKTKKPFVVEADRLLYQRCRQTFPNQSLSIFELGLLTSQSVTVNLQGKDSSYVIKDTPSQNPEPPTLASPRGTDVPLPEIINLHNDLDCLMADAQNNYGYMGAESGVDFNSAVRSRLFNPRQEQVQDTVYDQSSYAQGGIQKRLGQHSHAGISFPPQLVLILTTFIIT